MCSHLFLGNGIYAHLSNGPLIDEVLDIWLELFNLKADTKIFLLPLVQRNIIE
jgi:hypothetical protein